MATYVCRLGLPDGAIATRTIEAADEGALRSEIARLNARLFSVKVTADAPRAIAPGRLALPRFSLRSRRPVKPAEFLVFNQELVALLKAGLPIVSGFEILLERQENARFKAILVDIREQLISGVALSDAFLAQGDVFPRLYAMSLTAGERSREVDEFLRRYLSYR